MANNADEYLSDEEELECPLCMEEFDISDRTFKPCPCGYQICRFCYNRIVNSDTANGCPACRRQYSEETVEFKPLSAEEWKKDQQRIQTRKLKEKEKKELEMASRRHLSNMRVVQKNLVYVIGFSPKSADADLAATLRGSDYFAQYGKINKIVVNKKSHPNGQPTVGVYITYARKEDAARAIQAVDNSMNDGRILRASYGTTKYCSAYLRQQVCQNPNCMYLHEPGEDLDSYTREDMSTIQHAAKAAEGINANALASHNMRRQPSHTQQSGAASEDAQVALPATASWASKPAESDVVSPGDRAKPESLPAAESRGASVAPAIPPPPSQVEKGASHPSDVLPAPVQQALRHPTLGNTLKNLFTTSFVFNFSATPGPDLSEQDIKAAHEFPQLFSWNPDLKRPASPGKAARHARANSRYAFASDARSPPPGFVPPGLATNLQPPGFEESKSQRESDYTAEYLGNGGQKLAGAMDGAFPGSTRGSKMSTLNQGSSFDHPEGRNDKHPEWYQAMDNPHSKPTSKRTSFANMEAAGQGLSQTQDQRQQIPMASSTLRGRSAWEPSSSRPFNAGFDSLSAPQPSTAKQTHRPGQLDGLKGSRSWEPSPPPPKMDPTPSPSPGSAMAQGSRVAPPFSDSQSTFGASRSIKTPWEPSPPPILGSKRTQSPAKSLVSSPLKTEVTNMPGTSLPRSQGFVPGESMLAPRLPTEIAAPVAQTPPIKKGWDSVSVAVTPLEDQVLEAGAALNRTSSSASSIFAPTPARRDSVQSVATSFADVAVGRSRRNSLLPVGVEANAVRSRRGSVTSPNASRSSTPSIFGGSYTTTDTAKSPSVASVRPELKTTPSISSPLATLKTGKSMRIVSTPQPTAQPSAAVKRPSSPLEQRKSVPAASVKKSKEQRAAERKEKAAAQLAAAEAEKARLAAERVATASSQEVVPIVARAKKQKQPKVPNAKNAKDPVMLTSATAAQASSAVESISAQPTVAKPQAPTNELPVDAPDASDTEVIGSKTEALDIVQQLAMQMDLTKLNFFRPDSKLNKTWSYYARHGGLEFTANEMEQASQLLPSTNAIEKAVMAAAASAYGGAVPNTVSGKASSEGLTAEQLTKTIEHLERVLLSARKEADASEKRFEKMQRKNMRTIGIGIGNGMTA